MQKPRVQEGNHSAYPAMYTQYELPDLCCTTQYESIPLPAVLVKLPRVCCNTHFVMCQFVSFLKPVHLSCYTASRYVHPDHQTCGLAYSHTYLLPYKQWEQGTQSPCAQGQAAIGAVCACRWQDARQMSEAAFASSAQPTPSTSSASPALNTTHLLGLHCMRT